MGDRAGDLGVLAKIQQRIFAEAVQPNSAPRVTIADSHRNHPNVGGASAGVQRPRDDFSHDRHRNRAERILLSILASEHNLRTVTYSSWTRGHKTEVSGSGGVNV